MKAPLCLLPLLLAAPAFCAADANLLTFLPPDSQIVFGIHVRPVIDSSLARTLTQDLPPQAADLQKLMASSGFDPLHDLDEVLITTTGEGKDAPTLIAARGSFAHARQALPAGGESYNGVNLVSGKAQGDSVFGFLDDSTALAGSPALVKAAIDRRESPAHLPSGLASRVAEYREHYDIWGVVNSTTGFASMLSPTARSSGLDSIDRLQFGLALKSGLELAAEIHARSSKDAEQLASTLQFLQAMSQASQPAGSNGTRMAFKNVNGDLKLTVSVSEEDMKKAIEGQRKAGLLHAGTLAGPPSISAPAPVRVQSAEETPAPKPAPTAPKAAPSAAPNAPPAEEGGTAVFTLPSRR